MGDNHLGSAIQELLPQQLSLSPQSFLQDHIENMLSYDFLSS